MGLGGQGLADRCQGRGPPHLELPEHQVRVEVELEGAEEFQLLWDGERVRRRKPATSLTPSGQPGTVTMAPPRPPGRPAHHCGGGKDAGRGVGARHRGHLQEARRQPLPGHRKSQARAPPQRRALNPPQAPPRPPLANRRRQGRASAWTANGERKREGQVQRGGWPMRKSHGRAHGGCCGCGGGVGGFAAN